MKNVFLFPGQGAQKKGMLLDVCERYEEAKQIVELAEKITGEPVSKYMWETEEAELSRSDRSQLAITTASLALAEVLKSKGIECDICAGFSLGEFAALCVSGVLTFEETISLVAKRGKIMQKVCDELAASCNGSLPGMAAVIGLTPEQTAEAVASLEKEHLAFCANLNSPKQTVVSGTDEGLSRAQELCTAAGCRRFIRLKVAGPFHSPLMQKAGDEFKTELAKLNFKNPVKRLFSNVTGKEITTGEEAAKLAVLHFTNPVRWTSEEAEIAHIINFNNSSVNDNWKLFEVGPGTVLSGLWRDSGYSENISCNAINTVETLEVN
ncbi:MAG: ACP S-malonyltransferase [Treponema sp.]|nr:ACP S-malonyltransferase [Treponema sp.]